MVKAAPASAALDVGRAAIKLLYDVSRFKAPYPLALPSAQRIAPRLITSGLLVEDPDDRFLVLLTPAGRTFLHHFLLGDAS